MDFDGDDTDGDELEYEEERKQIEVGIEIEVCSDEQSEIERDIKIVSENELVDSSVEDKLHKLKRLLPQKISDSTISMFSCDTSTTNTHSAIVEVELHNGKYTLVQ